MNRINFFSHNWLALKINNDSLVNNIKFLKGRVIDLGCGSAQYKVDILRIADEYIGVDWKNSINNQSVVDVFADFGKSLPFHDSFVDTVISFQVLEHLPEPELFLSECYRILKSGGGLFLTVPFMWHVHEAPFDYYRYTRHGLKYLLKKVGFADINIHENTGFWQMAVLKFNYHSTKYAFNALKPILVPLWWICQIIAPLLDKYDSHPEECASYTVLAKKF